MPDDRLPLTPDSVKDFVQRLHSDAQLKSEVVSAISSGGSISMIQQFFAPTEKQLKTLTAHATSTKTGQQLLDSSILGALTTNGDIKMVQSPIARSSLGIHVNTGPVNIDVDIEC